MTTFRINKKHKILLVAGFILVLTETLLFTWLFFPSTLDIFLFSGGGIDILSQLAQLFLILGIVLMWAVVAASGYYIWYQWTVRLEFGEAGLRTLSIYLPRKPQVRCAYADIQSIVADKVQPILIITRKTTKPLKLNIDGFSLNPQSIIEEFTKHIPSECLDYHISKQVTKTSNIAHRNLFIIAACYVVIYPATLVIPIRNRVVQSSAWTSVDRPSLIQAYSIDAYSIEGNSDYVVVAGRNYPRDYLITAFKNGKTETWPLGTESQLPQPGPVSSFSPGSVAIDSAGRPWVASNFNGLLHWTGSTWEWYVFPDGTITDFVYKMVASGDKLLLAASSDRTPQGYYLQIDPVSNKAEEIPLPSDPELSTLEPSEAIPTRNGLIVTFTNNQGQGYFYLLQNGQWKKLAKIPDHFRPFLDSDFVRDPSGNLWLMSINYDDSNTVTTWIGQYANSTQTWNWVSIPGGQYESFVVDSKSRLWLKGKAYVDVYSFAPNTVPQLLVHYNEDNSGFQNNFGRDPLLLGSNGKLWIARQSLVWIDTQADPLPTPLPDWWVTLVSFNAYFYVWFPMTMLAYVFIFVVLISQTRRNWATKKQRSTI